MKYFLVSYWLIILGLFLYSYTQVDLNLTMSQLSAWQTIQKNFQHIGWFQRPLSTALYINLISLLFVFYFISLRLAISKKLTIKNFWQLFLPISLILLFSYNAFSYDLFNYMFDARIVTMHGENPYQHKALDYLDDPWITFMRWTHRTYPYGPAWLFLTVPLSFLGFKFFLPTFFLFKGFMAASFIGTVYFISKIAEKIAPEKKLFLTILFALNPLVIIESLVSAHNDIVMMFFAVWGLFFLLEKKYIAAFLLLVISIGIKFSTVFLLPAFLYICYLQIKKKTIAWEKIFLATSLIMLIPIIFSSQRTELQPWYLLWVLPLIALTPKSVWMRRIAWIFSLGLLLHYVPFLYTGNWDPPIPTIKFWITLGSIIFSLLLLGSYLLTTPLKAHRK